LAQLAPIVAKKRPATVEAWYWDGRPETADLIVEWINTTKGSLVEAEYFEEDRVIFLDRNVENVRALHWVVRDQFNDFWPLPNDVFMAVYETSFVP
jgi:hypothetical protein